MAPLPRSIYARGAAEVAPALLGCILVRRLPDGTVRRARIVETEAYVGEHDLASHARAGRTPRTGVMYGPPGHAYVYFVYGVHHMLNVVCAAPGDPQAVLVRAAEPLDGWDARMSGPGLVALALQLDRSHSGDDLAEGPLTIEPGPPPRRIGTGPRVGVAYAGPWAHRRLRFADADSPHVSRPAIDALSRRGRVAPPRGRQAL
ncbi:MAG TPA: DNA-3-methyladenine glycosylase [Candidatus Thermoplasmatota archaeon]|nr:DNA-3-methyladenine glycosylase [Candidatus Thermoplasmatota archaeon]